MKRAREALFYWSESTIALPLVTLLFVALCWAVLVVTGRPLLNDIGSLVDFGMAALKVMVWASISAVIQKCLFGYRTESGTTGREAVKPSLSDDIYDAWVTFGVMILTGMALAYWF